jgi:hypothetical protein
MENTTIAIIIAALSVALVFGYATYILTINKEIKVHN